MLCCCWNTGHPQFVALDPRYRRSRSSLHGFCGWWHGCLLTPPAVTHVHAWHACSDSNMFLTMSKTHCVYCSLCLSHTVSVPHQVCSLIRFVPNCLSFPSLVSHPSIHTDQCAYGLMGRVRWSEAGARLYQPPQLLLAPPSLSQSIPVSLSPSHTLNLIKAFSHLSQSLSAPLNLPNTLYASLSLLLSIPLSLFQSIPNFSHPPLVHFQPFFSLFQALIPFHSPFQPLSCTG